MGVCVCACADEGVCLADVFQPDPEYLDNEEKYKIIKAEILGEGVGSGSSDSEEGSEEDSEDEDEDEDEGEWAWS